MKERVSSLRVAPTADRIWGGFLNTPDEIISALNTLRIGRARRTLGTVVVRLGPAKVSHYPVTEVLRDVAIEASDRFGGSATVARDRFTPLLGIELPSDRAQADEVAEQNREMSALAIATASGAILSVLRWQSFVGPATSMLTR